MTSTPRQNVTTLNTVGEQLNMSELPCPYRLGPRDIDGHEVANCGLVQLLLRDSNQDTGIVARDACEACIHSAPMASTFVNDVFPSILNQACTEYLYAHELIDTTDHRAATLQQVTEKAIVESSLNTSQSLATCDVFVDCPNASDSTQRSIESILNQQNAEVIAHLILHPDAEPLANVYVNRSNVRLHRRPKDRSFFHVAHDLVPHVHSAFVAFQDGDATSQPSRISQAVAEMQRTGADLVGSPMDSPGGEIGVEMPSEKYADWIPWPTIVVRRSVFVDVGGFADRDGDQAAEFVFRLSKSGANLMVLPFPVVRTHREWIASRLGTEPVYEALQYSLRHHAIGFPTESVQCDVVLPVYCHLDYVDPAIQSVIEQDNAETIVHLIDDCSPENTHDLFTRWSSHPRVRLYRNTTNLGQYTSFNNVSRYFETDLVAVQDSDDISVPDRLSVSGNLLRLSDADFFAGTMKLFGDDDLIQDKFGGKEYRRSQFPSRRQLGYFAMNPTTCFRVSMFRRLGGYTDLGGPEYNRGGLDSEFMLRALMSDVRFAFSTSLVAHHRIHGESATMNSDTGFGSSRRAVVAQECVRRRMLFQSSGFDPRAFGGLRRYQDATVRVTT